MPNQGATSVLAAIKRETSVGVAAASGAGAYMLRPLDSPGLALGRNPIESGERRRDQLRFMGRLGGKAPDGTFNTEWTIGGAVDLFLESISRGTFVASFNSGSVSMTTTTSTIVRGAGSFITDGFREGHFVTISADSTTANNDQRLLLLSVAALTLTVYGTPLTLNATPRSFTVTALKRVVTPAGVAPTNTSYSIEQYDIDIDESELFIGCRLTGAAMSLRPNAMSTAAWSLMALDRQLIGTASAPYFTSPTETSGDALVADDAFLYYKGSIVTTLTGLDINMAIDGGRQPTLGSFVGPDVFMQRLTVTAEIQAIRQNLLALADFDAETEFAVGALLREPQGTPRPAIGIYLPRVKIGRISAAFIGGDAAKVETRTLMVGPHAGDTDTTAGAVYFSSSAA